MDNNSEKAIGDNMYCRREREHRADKEFQFSEQWGWVHTHKGGPQHTISNGCIPEHSDVVSPDSGEEDETLSAGRHGTTTLFAALEVATEQVTDACHPRHRHQEFLAFLKQLARAYPRRELHLVLGNYATHKHPAVQAWLAKHPRITLHFTPTSGSWLNMVEIFFGIIARQAIWRGTFTSVKESAIGTFIDGWNDRCKPFVWTKTPGRATRPLPTR